MARMGGINIKELKKFRDELKKLQNSEEFIESCAKELAGRLLRLVKKRTPVISGTLRNNWTIGEIKKEGGVYKINVINPVEYASYVEYGHRTPNHKGWTKGRFMMTISEQELEKIAPEILERKIQKHLRECFK